MNEKIVQITKEQVIPCIVDDKTVFRANLDKLTMIDLSTKSVAQIRKDMTTNIRLVYFVVEADYE